ncbi:ATP-binding protein, partial [Brevundimonas sp. A19_0]|uniref:ATP-binding protein n=1 Tax=Brevundimonas sp. A19_0 TaxID=2821087 RepID=UPI001ADC0622
GRGAALSGEWFSATAENPFTMAPAGPVAQAYGESRAPISVIVGPTGGGKTTESILRTFRIALWQHPSPIDGVRKARTVILAPTYRKLWDQFIPSYREVIKWHKNGWKGGTGEPAQHIYDFMWAPDPHTEPSPVHVEVLFRAPGEGDLEEFFRGLEATAFHFPEADTHESQDMFSLASNRAGRYPPPRDRPDPSLGLPDAYKGVSADANAPVIGSWFHKRFFVERRPNDRLFPQPPGYDPTSPDGFHPLAENAGNLRRIGRNYYRDMAANLEPWDVERLLRNRPGYSRHGQPVHPDFDPPTMVSTTDLEPDPDSPMVIGLDAGSNSLHHAAVFLQRTFGGQVRGFAEVVPDGQSDIVEVGGAIRRLMETRFSKVKSCVIVVDPAARGQTAMQRGLTWLQVLTQATGMTVVPAQTNDPRVRRTALDQILKRRCGPGEPGLVLSGPSMPRTTAALAGEYRFKRTGDKVSEIPEKSHPASDVADAVHYGALGLNGIGAIEGQFMPSGPDDGHSVGSQGHLLPE